MLDQSYETTWTCIFYILINIKFIVCFRWQPRFDKSKFLLSVTASQFILGKATLFIMHANFFTARLRNKNQQTFQTSDQLSFRLSCC